MQKRQNAVTFKGTPHTLVGPQLKAGDKAPNFTCLSGLDLVSLDKTPAKARLFSVVPSLDTARSRTWGPNMSSAGLPGGSGNTLPSGWIA